MRRSGTFEALVRRKLQPADLNNDLEPKELEVHLANGAAEAGEVSEASEHWHDAERHSSDSDASGSSGLSQSGRSRSTRCCTDNVKVLALTASLISTITAAQAIAALAAHSLALLQDCVSMGVDALTYLGNIGMETQRGTPREVILELITGTVSLALLLFFTLHFMGEAMAKLQGSEQGDEDEQTNPYIVLAFAIWGLLFDFAAIGAFFWNHRKSESGHQVNMCTAFLHVGADFLRSSTTLVASILMLGFGFDTTKTDAWASLLVGAIILAGACTGICGIVSQLHSMCSNRECSSGPGSGP